MVTRVHSCVATNSRSLHACVCGACSGQTREADLLHVQLRASELHKQLEAAWRELARARHAAADAEQRASRLAAELRRANELVRHAASGTAHALSLPLVVSVMPLHSLLCPLSPARH